MKNTNALSLRCGSLVYATDSGLGILGKAFYDNGILTDVLVVRHGRHTTNDSWYGSAQQITNLRSRGQIQMMKDLCRKVDVMLFLETPFIWDLIPICRDLGTKTVLVPMYECEPSQLPYVPDAILNPSLLDQQYYPQGTFIPIPVDTNLIQWRQRTRAKVFVHNAGHGGLKGRNGTKELLDALPLCKTAPRVVIRSQSCIDHPTLQLLKKKEGPDHTYLAGHHYQQNELLVDYRVGTFPYDVIWWGDVFIYPEKFNGLSLPLQEARAAGMLVMCGDRHPMNTWLPNSITCPGCDGEGSTMYQWAKKRCLETNGTKKILDDGSWYYITSEGKEIEFKTIGGPCGVCNGEKTINPLIPVSTYVKNRIGPPYNEFSEAIFNPKDIAAKIDELYDQDITDYSLSGKAWAESMSWATLKPRYQAFLQSVVEIK